MSDQIRILMSCYRCDPYGVSEAYAGFKWAEMLAERYRVTLCTPAYNAATVERYLAEDASEAVRQNLRLFPIDLGNVDSRLGALGAAVKPGFFWYEHKLLARLKREGMPDRPNLVWHRTPMSFRFRSRLHVFGVPLVIGPVGGGLKPPQALRSYFAGEGLLYRLRAFDGVLLGSRFWMRPFDAATRVLVTCDYVREILPRRLISKSVTVLDTGIEPRVRPLPERSGARVRVLYVGRLARYKAPTLAVEGFARFFDRAGRPGDVEMVVAGDGPERSAVAQVVRRTGLEGAVSLLGQVDKTVAERLYDESDVFLFPSITEASGNVYLEAMSAGMPLVVVDNGGGGGIPCDGCAMKIPVGTAEEIVEGIAAALTSLWESSALRDSMGAISVRCVGERYTWDAIARQAFAVVEDLVSESAGGEDGD